MVRRSARTLFMNICVPPTLNSMYWKRGDSVQLSATSMSSQVCSTGEVALRLSMPGSPR